MKPFVVMKPFCSSSIFFLALLREMSSGFSFAKNKTENNTHGNFSSFFCLLFLVLFFALLREMSNGFSLANNKIESNTH